MEHIPVTNMAGAETASPSSAETVIASNQSRRFWRSVGTVLIIGIGSWAANARFFDGDRTGWLRLQPDMASWISLGLGVLIWLGAGALCLGSFALVARARDFLDAVVAMWRAVAVVTIAGIVLFLTDQGRELGVSLLGESNLLPIGCLFIALLYWATNTWHTARWGLQDAKKKSVLDSGPANEQGRSTTRQPVKGNEAWLFWLPRLLGVFAHLFAAGSLAFAAWALPLAAWGEADPPVSGFDVRWVLRWLSWSAPVAIVLATAFVWAEDTMRSPRAQAFASEEKKKWAIRTRWIAIVGELLIVGGLGLVLGLRTLPQGFLLGTISISLSAFAFLAVISWWRDRRLVLEAKWAIEDKKREEKQRQAEERDGAVPLPPTVAREGTDNDIVATPTEATEGLERAGGRADDEDAVKRRAAARENERAVDDEREENEVTIFTSILFALACVVIFWAAWFPTSFTALGSMVVAYFAFGAILAVINFIDACVRAASETSFVRRQLGTWATPRGVGACLTAVVIAFGALNAWLHPFHRVRLCDGDCFAPKQQLGFLAAAVPNDRPTAGDAALNWYSQAKMAYGKVHPGEPVPMLIVAAAGGGIRAAYWTATILEQLEKDLAAEGGVRPYLFAVSAVSGGSVGAAAFEAALTKRDESCAIGQSVHRAAKPGDKGCPPATDFLKGDFLAPPLAKWIFVDTPASFLPDFGVDDRGAALERSFENASDGLLARPFLSFFRRKVENSEDISWWRPILLLNGTHEETGNRIIASHVRIDRDVFLESFDELDLLGQDVRASTAAHNSARFTYVSPAGDLGHRRGSVIDGGYFENYGALTALELARAAKQTLKGMNPGVKLIFLLISSDPSLDEERTRVRIRQPKEGPRTCLVSAAERETGSRVATDDPNYQSVDPNKFENAWFNELVAPLQGAYKVREAHGNRAAAELAVEICTEIPAAPLPPGTGAAQALNAAKNVNFAASKPFEPLPNDPFFAHLAMCTEKPGETPTFKAPLGWALSKTTQDAFDQQLFLKQCGNDVELRELEVALGKRAP